MSEGRREGGRGYKEEESDSDPPPSWPPHAAVSVRLSLVVAAGLSSPSPSPSPAADGDLWPAAPPPCDVPASGERERGRRQGEELYREDFKTSQVYTY